MLPSPEAGFMADDTTIVVDGAVHFTDESTGNPTSWSWDFGDGNTSTDQNPSHTYSSVGTHTVELAVSNECGEDTATKINYIYVESDGLTACDWNDDIIFTDDRDGQEYNQTKINDQCWMAENLNYDQDSYGNDWCYDNNSSNCDTYGRLYDWDALMQGASSSNSNPSGVQGVCPDGWHVPSDEEWKELEMQLGMSQSEADSTGYRGTNEGSKLAGDATLWDSGDLTDNLEFGSSGFTALPGGFRYSHGDFYGIGSNGLWWSSAEGSSTDAWYRTVYWNYTNVSRYNHDKEYGYSVRCVRDD
ncbi:MAG: FISUMP domain-containing protein [Bacteroidales bacterium]